MGEWKAPRATGRLTSPLCISRVGPVFFPRRCRLKSECSAIMDTCSVECLERM